MIDIVIILVKNIHKKKNTFGYDGKKEIKKPDKSIIAINHP